MSIARNSLFERSINSRSLRSASNCPDTQIRETVDPFGSFSKISKAGSIDHLRINRLEPGLGSLYAVGHARQVESPTLCTGSQGPVSGVAIAIDLYGE